MLNLLNLLCNKVNILLIVCFVFLNAHCKKDTIVIADPPPVVIDTVKPKISFAFVNRFGSINDTNSNRWFTGVTFEAKFYNPEVNISRLISAASRKHYNDPVKFSDSIELIKFNNIIGAQFAFKTTMYWIYSDNHYRDVTFTTKNWPNACDTIKILRDTIIKFVYPDDTVENGRYTKSVRVY